MHQKKTILELKNLMAKYDNTSIDFSPEDSTILNATSPVKPSKVICKRLFFISKPLTNPEYLEPEKNNNQPPKKKTTTCRATTIPSHNHCWSQKAKSGHSGKKLVRCLLYLLEIRYNFMCIDVIFRVLYENNPSACFILSVKIYIWSYVSSFFYLYQKYS